jgi:nicotinate dehydrogenase subunit A
MLPARPITLQVNGRSHALTVPPQAPLLTVLRNDLGLNGPKYGCGLGECGACTVLVDGVAARACVMPVAGVAGRAVTTLEGLATAGEGGPPRLHPVQQAFVSTQAAQCGYCLNGMVMTTVALLRTTPRPTPAEARAALSHNLCRCGTHIEILAAVDEAARLVAAAALAPAEPVSALPGGAPADGCA